MPPDAAAHWTPQTSLTLKHSRVNTHLDAATGIVRETHLALHGITGEPKPGSEKHFYYHRNTDSHKFHETMEAAVEEARAKRWGV